MLSRIKVKDTFHTLDIASLSDILFESKQPHVKRIEMLNKQHRVPIHSAAIPLAAVSCIMNRDSHGIIVTESPRFYSSRAAYYCTSIIYLSRGHLESAVYFGDDISGVNYLS